MHVSYHNFFIARTRESNIYGAQCDFLSDTDNHRLCGCINNNHYYHNNCCYLSPGTFQERKM